MIGFLFCSYLSIGSTFGTLVFLSNLISVYLPNNQSIDRALLAGKFYEYVVISATKGTIICAFWPIHLFRDIKPIMCMGYHMSPDWQSRLRQYNNQASKRGGWYII